MFDFEYTSGIVEVKLLFGMWYLKIEYIFAGESHSVYPTVISLKFYFYKLLIIYTLSEMFSVICIVLIDFVMQQLWVSASKQGLPPMISDVVCMSTNLR